MGKFEVADYYGRNKEYKLYRKYNKRQFYGINIFSSNEKCNVCTTLKDKVNAIGKKYNIKVFNVNIDNFKEASGRYNIFTVPTTLFYIEGKEILREGRYTSLIEFEKK